MAKTNESILKRRWSVLARVLVGYILFSTVFFWASGDQLFYQTEKSNAITAKDCAAVMTNGTSIQFPITVTTDTLDRVSLLVGTYGRVNHGTLSMTITSEDGSCLSATKLNTEDLKDYVYQNFDLEPSLDGLKGEKLFVTVLAENVPENEGTSLWYGDSIDTGRFSVPDMSGSTFCIGEAQYDGKVCYSIEGRNILWIGAWYWRIVLCIGLTLAVYGAWTIHKLNEGGQTKIVGFARTAKKYVFLVRQLVERDFKRKYKRSALGIFWSFLNPLLTMLVQYLVFSTIFNSSIENFVVYLLSGIILFNFFGESVGLGLGSIVDNAHLINKVYMPKEIYPLSRVLSSAINLGISLVPLFIVMVVTKVSFSKSMLLIPIGLVCLIVFCLGMSMLLSTAMVFFRDTYFLWNVLSTLWMYLTPTFYPIDIIPVSWLPIYKLNPMYQYIAFLRSILLDGVAPAPGLYAGCVVSACAMFAVGYVVFKRNQDKFVLYL